MDQPVARTPEFRVRDAHRGWLIAHFAVFVLGLGVCVALNRALTPETFWVPWVGLGWGAVFAAHLLVFARATLATMGDHHTQ
jgi:2TM domain-containing protein